MYFLCMFRNLIRRILRRNDARRELHSIWLWIMLKNETNWYSEVATGEGQSSLNMEEGMAWRDQEDDGFGLEFQGVNRKGTCVHM